MFTMRSNICRSPDGFEFTCWNHDVIRAAFIFEAHDWDGFQLARRRIPVAKPSDNGPLCIALETRIFTRQFGLNPCFTPMQNPQTRAACFLTPRKIGRDALAENSMTLFRNGKLRRASSVGPSIITLAARPIPCQRLALSVGRSGSLPPVQA